MALIRENGGLDIIFCVRDPEKAILGRNRMFWRILRQNPSTALGCCELQEPKKLTRFWCAKSRMRRNETPGRIVMNCCTDVEGQRRNHLCRFVLRSLIRGLGVAGGQILGFSIDLIRRPYDSLALPCVVRVCDRSLDGSAIAFYHGDILSVFH